MLSTSQNTDEAQDKAVLHSRDARGISELSEAHYASCDDRLCDAWTLYTEDETLGNDDSMHSNATFHMKKPCYEDYYPEYIGQIKEFQIYLDTVKKIIRPGCSKEVLDAALNSMSSLIETLSVISSKRVISASL